MQFTNPQSIIDSDASREIKASVPTTAPFDRARQFANKRQAVIRAAGESFRRQGYHNSSIKDIAASLGLTKTALYYYVKSKEEILYECHLMVYGAMDDVLAQNAMQKENGTEGENGLEQLCRVFSDLVKLLTQNGLSLLTDVSSLSGAYETTVLQRRARIEQAIMDIVKTGMKDGSIRKGDPALCVYFFMGALNWLNAWYRSDGRLEGDYIARQFTQQMRSGIEAAQPA